MLSAAHCSNDKGLIRRAGLRTDPAALRNSTTSFGKSIMSVCPANVVTAPRPTSSSQPLPHDLRDIFRCEARAAVRRHVVLDQEGAHPVWRLNLHLVGDARPPEEPEAVVIGTRMAHLEP